MVQSIDKDWIMAGPLACVTLFENEHFSQHVKWLSCIKRSSFPFLIRTVWFSNGKALQFINLFFNYSPFCWKSLEECVLGERVNDEYFEGLPGRHIDLLFSSQTLSVLSSLCLMSSSMVVRHTEKYAMRYFTFNYWRVYGSRTLS